VIPSEEESPVSVATESASADGAAVNGAMMVAGVVAGVVGVGDEVVIAGLAGAKVVVGAFGT
jgi:hypothetical protein